MYSGANANKISGKPADFHQAAAEKVQTKLKVNTPDDVFEREADRMAERVVTTPENTVHTEGVPFSPLSQRALLITRKLEAKNPLSLDKKSNPALLQRKESREIRRHAQLADEKLMRKKEAANAQLPLSKEPFVFDAARFEAKLTQTKGKGKALPRAVCQEMEAHFGADFRNIRIHTDSAAVLLCQHIAAQAFTHGNDIYFANGKFNVATKTGKYLLAHELTHTIQQGAARQVQTASPQYESDFLRKNPVGVADKIELPQPNTTNAEKRLHPRPHDVAALAGVILRMAEKSVPTLLQSGERDLLQCMSDTPIPTLLQTGEQPNLTAPVPNLAARSGKNILQRSAKQGAAGLARGEISKGVESKKVLDGNRKGYERLTEYFEKALGAGMTAAMRAAIKQPAPPLLRDTMPSWCGIFVWWSLRTAGVPLFDWALGERNFQEFDTTREPQVGDVAHKSKNAHFALVSGIEGSNIRTVNGNTSGEDNLGGQIEEKSEPLSNWLLFFKMPDVSGEKLPPVPKKPLQPPRGAKEPPKLPTPPKKKSSAKTKKAEKGRTLKHTEGEAKIVDIAEPSGGSPIMNTLRKASAAMFKKSKSGVARLARNEKKKEAANVKVATAESAVVPPVRETESQANSGQVEKVDSIVANKPEPKDETAKKKVQESLTANLPKSLEESDNFQENGKGTAVGEDVKNVVNAEAGEVKTTYSDIENAPPPAPTPTPEATPEMEQPNPTSSLSTGENVVGETTAEQKDMSKFEKDNDSVMQKEGITDEQMSQVDEGELADAKKDRANLKAQVKAAPHEVKAAEETEKKAVKEDMHKEEKATKNTMRQNRQKQLKGANDDQKKTKSKIEFQREAVTAKINGKYETANSIVKAKLLALETQSLKAFDDGQRLATQKFEIKVKKRIEDFKDDRYSGIRGPFRWVRDKWKGMDDLPQVKRIFDEERAAFERDIEATIKKITDDSKRVVKECKEVIAKTRLDISEYVKTLKGDLTKTGKQALQDVSKKLDALDNQVNEKQKELNKKLTERREKAMKAIDDKIAKMKEGMKGLANKLMGFLLDALVKLLMWAMKKIGADVPTIKEKIGKTQEAMRTIAKSPGKFFDNLGAAIKKGANQFDTNFNTHFVGGVLDWLTGAMRGVPIKLPAKFDGWGIASLLLQIFGLTKENLRFKFVERLGEERVRLVEKAADLGEKGFEFIQKIRKGGLEGIKEMALEHAEEMKSKAIDALLGWLTIELVKAAVKKLLLMLNPAGALLQIAMAIYNVVMFFVENIQRIIDFVMSVFSSIADVAMGKIASAANFIEKALAKTIPIIIAFFARMIGLGNIGQAVKAVLKKIQAPVDKVLNKVVDKVAVLAKKVIDKGKALVDKGKQKVAAVTKKVKDKLVSWWKLKKGFQGADKKNHTLFFKGEGKNAELKVASNEQTIEIFLKEKSKVIKDYKGKDKVQLEGALKKAQGRYKIIKKKEDDIVKVPPTNIKLQGDLQKELKELLSQISEDIKPLFALNEQGDPPPTILPLFSNNVKSQSIDVSYISHKTPHGENTDAYENNDNVTLLGWKELYGPGTNIRVRDNFVKMHILHHKLGGKATDSNFTPAKGGINSAFYHTIEKHAVESKNSNVIWYKTDLTYHSTPNDKYIRKIEVSYGFHGSKAESFARKKAEKRWSQSVAPPNFDPVRIYRINEDGKSMLGRFKDKTTGMSLNKSFISLLIDERNESASFDPLPRKRRNYETMQDIETRFKIRIDKDNLNAATYHISDSLTRIGENSEDIKL